MKTSEQQLFKLREQLEVIRMHWLAEMSVNAQDQVHEHEVEMKRLQAKINQLIADGNLEPRSNQTMQKLPLESEQPPF